MPTEKKVAAVARLAELLSRCTIALVTDYRGLSVSELSRLRRSLAGHSIEYHVVKNSLARLAATKVGRAALGDLLVGPSAIAFGFGDIQELPKAIAEFVRSSQIELKVKGAVLENRLLGVSEISALSTLPSRPVLISRVLAGMQAPIYGLLNVLTANTRGLVQLLQARIQQLEGGQHVTG